MLDPLKKSCYNNKDYGSKWWPKEWVEINNSSSFLKFDTIYKEFFFSKSSFSFLLT